MTNIIDYAATLLPAAPVKPPCAELAIFAARPQLRELCAFDKTATSAIITFEVVVIIATIAAIWGLSHLKDKLWQRYLIMAIGVFLFEFFTSPMWNNYKLGPWAYVYQDVSWVLTLGWTTLILTTVILIDKFFASLRTWQRFGLYLLFLTVAVLILESIVVNLGIRSYAPEVQAVFLGYKVFGVNIEVFYYVPVFMTLVISFYKYWSLVLDQDLIIPVKKRRWLGSLVLSILGIFLFELMIEPMVVNTNLPSWSYIYRDVSILMTGLWVLLIWLAIYIVDRFFIHLDLAPRFVIYLGVIAILILPLEAWFINNGFRVYGPSATANFTGFTTVITNIPVEVSAAIPLYLALVIAFIRYWEMGLSHR